MTPLSGRTQRTARAAALVGLAAVGMLLVGCGGNEDNDAKPSGRSASSSAARDLDEVKTIGAGRRLYVRCKGTGSPTVVMEAGDGDTSDQYAFAEPAVSKVARTCVYDRANLGRSGPAPGPRGLSALVGDLERLLKTARIPGPYVLVGTSGGGFITAGYASAHPRQIAGLVFVDTGAPLKYPPPAIVEATAPDNPANVERRDFLQVEKDAWAARKRIGDIPVTILTVEFSAAAINESPFPSERRAMRRNVERQRGWLALSPRAKQIVVHTGHAVEEDDPQLVIDALLDVVKAAQ
jgi:pimeloyl-ACP methyl ester carboxylesterase